MRNPSLNKRHWEKVETILNHKFTAEEPLTLGLLTKLNAFNFTEEIEEVSGQASSEAALESLLKKVGLVYFKLISYYALIYEEV